MAALSNSRPHIPTADSLLAITKDFLDSSSLGDLDQRINILAKEKLPHTAIQDLRNELSRNIEVYESILDRVDKLPESARNSDNLSIILDPINTIKELAYKLGVSPPDRFCQPSAVAPYLQYGSKHQGEYRFTFPIYLGFSSVEISGCNACSFTATEGALFLLKHADKEDDFFTPECIDQATEAGARKYAKFTYSRSDYSEPLLHWDNDAKPQYEEINYDRDCIGVGQSDDGDSLHEAPKLAYECALNTLVEKHLPGNDDKSIGVIFQNGGYYSSIVVTRKDGEVSYRLYDPHDILSLRVFGRMEDAKAMISKRLNLDQLSSLLTVMHPGDLTPGGTQLFPFTLKDSSPSVAEPASAAATSRPPQRGTRDHLPSSDAMPAAAAATSRSPTPPRGPSRASTQDAEPDPRLYSARNLPLAPPRAEAAATGRDAELVSTRPALEIERVGAQYQCKREHLSFTPAHQILLDPDLKSDLSERDIAMKLQELRDSSPSVYARITKQAEDKKLLSERKIQLSTAGQKADWIAIFIKASLPNSPEIKEKIKNQAIAKGLIIEGKIGSPTPESIEAWRKIFNDNMPRSLCSADDMTDALYRLKQPSPEKHTALIEAAKASGLMTDEVMHFKNKLPQWNALLDIFLSDTSAVSFAKKLMERLRQHVSALVSLIDDPAKKIMPSEFDLFKGYHALLDVAFKESPLLSTGSIRAEIERSGHDYTWRHIIHYLHQTLNDPDHRF